MRAAPRPRRSGAASARLPLGMGERGREADGVVGGYAHAHACVFNEAVAAALSRTHM